jgi:hypothetical protein
MSRHDGCQPDAGTTEMSVARLPHNLTPIAQVVQNHHGNYCLVVILGTKTATSSF